MKNLSIIQHFLNNRQRLRLYGVMQGDSFFFKCITNGHALNLPINYYNLLLPPTITCCTTPLLPQSDSFMEFILFNNLEVGLSFDLIPPFTLISVCSHFLALALSRPDIRVLKKIGRASFRDR